VCSLIAAPEQPCWEEQNHEPKKERGTGLGEEQHDASRLSETVRKPLTAALRSCIPTEGAGDVSWALYSSAILNRSWRSHAVFERFLLSFHMLDLPADARDFLFDLEDVLYLAGASAENILESLLGLAGILKPCHKVGVLLGDFFAVLRFSFKPTRAFSSARAAVSCGAGMRKDAWSMRAAPCGVATFSPAA